MFKLSKTCVSNIFLKKKPQGVKFQKTKELKRIECTNLTLLQDLVQAEQLLWKPTSFFGSLWGKISVHPRDNTPQLRNICY